MTDEQREAYREAKRQEAEQALDALLTEEGWANWLRLRRGLHSYSWGNQALIAGAAWAQATMAEEGHPEAPLHPCSKTPVLVKAAWKWKRDGYHPARGSRGLPIWVFNSRRRKDRTWFCCGVKRTENACPECHRPDHYFTVGRTFDASQVVSFETGEAPVIELPQGQPIEGDDLAWMLDELVAIALREDWCSAVEMDVAPEMGEGGWFRLSDRVIGVCPAAANAQLRTLIHELAHALGISSKKLDLSYAECEVAVECVSFMVASTVGLDTSGESIPYMAGWGGAEAREKVRGLAQLIDATAKKIEAPLLELLEARDAEAVTA